MVVSTTVITNADVPVTEPQPAPAATAATATPAVPATPQATTVTDPLPTREELARDAGATAEPARTAAPQPASPATEPPKTEPKTDEPTYRYPSAADRIPWAGDSNSNESR